jgi:Flp pilus assembly protein TadD
MAFGSYFALIFLPFLPLAGADFAGSRACAGCHVSQTRGFQGTPMGRSFAPPSLAAAPELGNPVQFVHPKTGRHYRIFPRQGQFFIQEFFLDGEKRQVYSDLRAIRYAIGSGNHAQSFLVERDGQLYQAPVAFYSKIPAWDMAPGYDTENHTGFTRRVGADCLFCHAEQNHALGCERCHGPGKNHAARPPAGIVNPAKLQPALRVEVCEQCHLFGAARILQHGKSAADYRPGGPLGQVFAIFDFAADGPQPAKVTGHSEQMKRSRCWRGAPDRLWCGSCHQVHTPTPAADKEAFYRAKCLTCHATHGCSRRLEPGNAADRANDCIACHMPKQRVLESAHVAFTDHEISRFPRLRPDAEPSTTVLQPLVGATNGAAAARNLAFAELQAASSTGRPEFLRQAVTRLESIGGSGLADAEFWQDLGSAYLELRQLRQAESSFRQAIAMDAKSAGSYYSLGFVHQAQSRLPEAAAAYQRAVSLDPEMAIAWGNLASARLATGDRDGALRALQTALRIDPGNVDWIRVRRDLERSTAAR